MVTCLKCNGENGSEAIFCVHCGNNICNDSISKSAESDEPTEDAAQIEPKPIQAISIAKGRNGSIELYQDKVTIKRKGALAFLTQGLKGDKDIRLTQVSAVQFKNAGIMTSGYLQLTVTGGNESRGGLFAGVNDENTVMFLKKNQPEFIKIKKDIESKLSLIDSAQTVNAGTTSNLDELEKLASLRDKDIITEDEFNLKKKQLLGL